ncbi:lipid A biosynthesis acyltransferase [bacterium]|nr:lipid A biosynthesis acyltransferase [bacterium]
MTTWKGQSRGNLLGYKLFFWILRNLGLGFAYFILRFVALYFFFFSFKAFRPSWYYFGQRLEMGFWRSLLSIYRNKYVFGQVLIDKVALMSEMGESFTFDFEGRQEMWKTLNQGKGAIIVSAHAGNWEAASHFFSTLGREDKEKKVNVVMFDGEHQQIKRFFEGVMTEKKIHIIVIKQDLSHLIEINRAMKANEIICLHGDRFVEGSKTIDCEFLGENARFPMGPFYMASRYNKPLAFTLALKAGKKHYRFEAMPYSGEDTSPEATAQAFAHWLGEKMSQYPTQWFNFYHFWK